jgi:C-22 sterol desaturase
MMENVTSAQPEPQLAQTWLINTSKWINSQFHFYEGWTIWQWLFVFLLSVVVYDQGIYIQFRSAVEASVTLTLLQVMYLVRKGPIAGPPFKIPLMGPFLRALDPKFEAYLSQWASGPISCVSIFHKLVVLSISLFYMQ